MTDFPKIGICANCGKTFKAHPTEAMEHSIEHVSGNTKSIVIQKVKNILILAVTNEKENGT